MASSTHNQIGVTRSDSVQTRQGIWNTVQLGGTYDIKQSMIGSLPGDQKQPMSDHIQLVCMLQAAEIERLTEILNEYKQMYYSLDKNELDRHSYEVQIKELAERAFEADGYQSQVKKLKEFIQLQSIQLQSVRNRLDESGTVRDNSTEYNNVLREIQSYMQSTNQLKHQIQVLEAQVAQGINKYDSLKNQQFQLQQARKSEYEFVITEKDKEIQQLNFRFDSERSELERQLKRLSILVQSNQVELDQFSLAQQKHTQLQEENKRLSSEIYSIQRELNSERREILHHTSFQQQLKLEIYTKTIELNRLLEELSKTKLNNSSVSAEGQSIIIEGRQKTEKTTKLQQKALRLEADYQLLRIKHSQLRDLHEKLHNYEQKLNVLSEFPVHLNPQHIREHSQARYMSQLNIDVKSMGISDHSASNRLANYRVEVKDVRHHSLTAPHQQ